MDQIAENSVENWAPPDEVRREFPYYVSGFDKQKRPSKSILSLTQNVYQYGGLIARAVWERGY